MYCLCVCYPGYEWNAMMSAEAFACVRMFDRSVANTLTITCVFVSPLLHTTRCRVDV